MKRTIRHVVAFAACALIIILIYLQAMFRGKRRAVRSFGPIMTKAAKRALRYWVPDIPDASRFNDFKGRMKRNFRLWGLLYDIDVAEDTPDTFKIHVRNCPFCDVFTFVGLSDINNYICKADWEIAEDNRGKWLFERQHTIEAGDRFCDHTYKRNLQQQAMQPLSK
jgi:hypothetical protein